METNKNEAKEFLLIEIENAATWRAIKAEQFPDKKEINLNSHIKLLELYDYVENLPDSHQIFYWYLGTFDEGIKEWISAELRMFGYQNQKESPHDLINRLVKEGINEGLIDNTLDGLNCGKYPI
jgi:predicted DNA-binding transcriptional regulator YafY